MASYPFKEIEKKWQKFWEVQNIYKVEDDFTKPKYYVLDMFPYPSGAGLHIGHPEGYTASDIIARYKKMKGYNVLHPIGFDAFGLPTERYSMVNNIHPEIATERNIKNFRSQLNMIGFNYDWSREVNTTNPKYYKWTQWMFLLIYNSWFDEKEQKAKHIDTLPIPNKITDPLEIENYKDKHRLAYISEIPVNWCEALGTVLANEEVDEWREKGYTVERKPMKQWMIKITKYAQRLLDDLELVDWPHSTMEMQKNWIGKSEGADVNFPLPNSDRHITVFTTRPDTIFGATYMVLAPEHPLLMQITTDDKLDEVKQYIEQSSKKTDMERTELSKDKTGVFTGGYAINPATGRQVPILIADYVLGHYGTGAIMAVPAHDERDYEFAKKYNLPIIPVVKPADGTIWDFEKEAFTSYDGVSNNSTNDLYSITELPTTQAKKKIIEEFEKLGIGKGKIQYKLRDWLFSRQRYWGEPIPIMFFEDGTKRALDLDELPLKLPYINDFKPAGTGESPLAKVLEWIDFIDNKTGKRARLETNTMPQWAGSCWYYLRYLDPHNPDTIVEKEKEKYWMGDRGVDLYIGGAEHAVLHLLYARFWHKVLYDYGHVSTTEPFMKLFHQGLILGADGNKMSKSMGNVVNPEPVIDNYGADSLRLFEMFLGPLEQAKPWSETGIEGVFRFLNKVWRMYTKEDGTLSHKIQDMELNSDQEFVLHSTIKKVGEDIERLRFNTAISQMMIFVNEFSKYEVFPKQAAIAFVKCLASFAPHIAEEIWQIMGNENSIYFESFPEYDEAKTIQNTIEFVLQVASKIRGKLTVRFDAEQSEVEPLALADENVQKFIADKQIVKVVFVKNKLINFIIK